MTTTKISGSPVAARVQSATTPAASTQPAPEAQAPTSGWAPKAPAQKQEHGLGGFFKKVVHTIEDGAAEAIGVAELAGLRYPVSSYSAKVSDGLTRGSRLEGQASFNSLQSQGFKSIVDLTLEGTDDEKFAKGAGLNALNLKILDNSAPSMDQMKQFLDFATNPANEPCYVHCEAGKGRTGVATACYRMAVQGWPLDKALTDAKSHGLALPNQIEFLQQFDAKLSAGQIPGYHR